ncbi:MAG TPA: LytR C-terminal domain-containing protein [Spirochaetota bacterium]|nr:LytR C-terminal domain-containing protein [Spirochaetota bacterium]HNT10676.1 LytR C-terminal domain-containing protein [Spirochaetota bacterium]HOS41072.1 LytR C-terminal domain-containing protein [Spirochaetota bacterium]
MKRKLFIGACGVIAITGILIAYYVYTINTRNVIETLISSKKIINILIGGSNTYNRDRHRLYALVSINPENGKIVVTFIPPSFNLNSHRKGSSPLRIDEVDFTSFKKVSDALNNNLKINIPFYIQLYAPDVKRAVDMIEGVDLFVLDQKRDRDPIASGVQYFDGERIMRYINAVDDDSIFRKYDRVQDVLLTLYHNGAMYKRFATMPFLSELFSSITTNMLPQELLSLSEILLKRSEMLCATLPATMSEDGVFHFDDIAYKIYESKILKRLVIKDTTAPSIKVKILNGSGVPGLARKIRNILIRDGLSVMEFGTSPYPPIDKTVIINQKGDMAEAIKVSELLGINQIYHVVDNTQLHSVLIILGKDLAK